MANKDLGKTSTGLQPNVAALLSYVAGIVTGIIFFVIEKENKFVRFHAMQSIILFGGLFVLQIALVFTVILIVLVPFLNIAGLIAWIILMVKAYQGEYFKLPVIGDLAEKNIGA
jgi:uncharacterized membrane protein